METTHPALQTPLDSPCLPDPQPTGVHLVLKDLVGFPTSNPGTVTDGILGSPGVWTSL